MLASATSAVLRQSATVADIVVRDVGHTSRKTQSRVLLGRRHVLRELHAGGPRTASELTSAVRRLIDGYSRDSVEARLAELREAGLVRVGDASEVGLDVQVGAIARGRPPSYATLSDAWGSGLGLEVGRQAIKAAVVSPSGEVRATAAVPRPLQSFGETMRAVASCAASLWAQTLDGESGCVRGAVVALPAPVDRRSGRLVGDLLPGWPRQGLETRIADVLGMDDRQVFIANDANVRAIAEGRFGLARALHSAFVVKASGGLGGCYLRRGRVSRGARGMAGELGHMSVDLDRLERPPGDTGLPMLDPNAKCSCGDEGGQHLEVYASTTAIAHRVGQARGRPRLRFEDVLDGCWDEGDARIAISDASTLLGQAFRNVALMCDPAAIIVTGRLAAGGEKALTPAQDVLDAMRPLHEPQVPILVDGPGGAGSGRVFEWLGVRGAGRLAIEITTSADEPPDVAETG